MRAEKLGIALQRFRKYSSSFHAGTAGFVAEKRRRFRPFSAAIRGRRREAVFVRRISWDVSARAVESVAQTLLSVLGSLGLNVQNVGISKEHRQECLRYISSKLLNQPVEHASELLVGLYLLVDLF